VKAVLVRRGVPAGAIEVTAYGESLLESRTRDGVPDANNRIVQIDFVATSACTAATAGSDNHVTVT
jgi:outer membrane protein OmpA-like peptidoglycan-associated protein